ncbi:uncharacterized protein [Chanodichthys erythropterus]|uniref:uncharacterized protein n=1 Tax=Chanodichthys erythropterus TaxID=933992 RepID=UPI00351F221C
MELFIFIAFQLFVKVQSYSPFQKPTIHNQGDSIMCSIPVPDRNDFICHLYTEDGLLYTNVSETPEWAFRGQGNPYCRFYFKELTGSVNRQLSCDYSISSRTTSPRSDTIIIGDLPQAKLTASPSVIQETDTVQLSCENTGNLKIEMCVFYIHERESNSKWSSSCQLSLTRSEISIWSEGQSSSVRISCFYTVNYLQYQRSSPHSDPVTVQTSTATSTGETLTDKTTSVFSPASAPQTTRQTQTSVPHSDHIPSEVSWLSVVLVFTGVGLFLSGLMGFICLCHFDSSDDLLTEVNYSSCQVEQIHELADKAINKEDGTLFST